MKAALKFRFWQVLLCCVAMLIPTLALAHPTHPPTLQTYAIAAASRLHIGSTAMRCSGELLLSVNPAPLSLELHATPKAQHPALESIYLLISIPKDNLPKPLQASSYIQGTLTINNNISQPITLKSRLKIKRGKPHTLKLSGKVSSHALANGAAKLKATLILSELL